MKKFCWILFVVLLVVDARGQNADAIYPASFRVKVTNPAREARANVLVVLSPADIARVADQFNADAFVVMDGTQEIASQYNHHDGDDAGIVFVLDKLAASASRNISVRYNKTGSVAHHYTPRTHAELSRKTGGEWKGREYMGGSFQPVTHLRVPPEHKDHSWFIRYEGPGWESDKVGYRFYLDQRNASDVFGKTVTEPVLQNVGVDGFESYHHMQPWGMDVMKVGKSLGIGSIGARYDDKTLRVEKTDSVSCTILEDGPVFSSISTHYAGWQVGPGKHDLRSRISIYAGTRVTHQQLTFDKSPEQLVTGIVKDSAATVFKFAGDNKQWAYLATWGKQSLNNDALGLAVLVKPATGLTFTEDAYSHIVTLKPGAGKVDYYFLAAWIGEPGGITTEAQFVSYVTAVAKSLANPVQVSLSRVTP